MDKSVVPSISVLMPVYNASAFLREAIESILDQTFCDFELLIFNDASNDDSALLIKSFNDSRIRFFSSEFNQGYVHHLNEGIQLARGKYIARMDADDISEKERLEKQFNFMESHPEVGICGAQVVTINETGVFQAMGYHYHTDAELRIRLLSDSCFAHPLVMIRKSILIENKLYYKAELMPAEDYAMWVELSLISCLANLPDFLLRYRVHSNQITKKKREKQQLAVASIRKEVLERFLACEASDTDVKFHNSLLEAEYACSRTYVEKAKEWIVFLIKKNEERGYFFNDYLFQKEMARIWFSLCTHVYQLGPWIIYTYFTFEIDRSSISKRKLFKFLLKSLLGRGALLIRQKK